MTLIVVNYLSGIATRACAQPKTAGLILLKLALIEFVIPAEAYAGFYLLD